MFNKQLFCAYCCVWVLKGKGLSKKVSCHLSEEIRQNLNSRRPPKGYRFGWPWHNVGVGKERLGMQFAWQVEEDRDSELLGACWGVLRSNYGMHGLESWCGFEEACDRRDAKRLLTWQSCAECIHGRRGGPPRPLLNPGYCTGLPVSWWFAVRNTGVDLGLWGDTWNHGSEAAGEQN